MLMMASFMVAGCSMQVKDHETGEHKNVRIDTPLGGLKVRTDDVEAKDAGLSVYPGAVLKENDDDHKNDKKANVNIDTPWFGLKVVALSYQSSDAPEKVWDFYRKDMAKYGRVLECKAGSPDLQLAKKEKDDLTCKEDKKFHVSANKKSEMLLKVGTETKQRIVAMKPSGGGTEFSLVYVVTREGKETL